MQFLSPENYPQPHPRLTPRQVVSLQLDALQNNDLMKGDMGIRLAFMFASPQNRATTGPVERFIALVKNPLYAGLIGFERAEFGPLRMNADNAQQLVRLHYHRGDDASYVFSLSRQIDGVYTGCWMVDGVLPAT